MERDPINYPEELENNLPESNSDRKSDPEVEYHKVSVDEELWNWGVGLVRRKR